MASDQQPNIEALFQKIIRIFDDEELSPVYSFSEDLKRVRYARRLLHQRQMLPLQPLQRGLKDAAGSKLHRDKGNLLYAKAKDFEALQCYNKAIACAPVDSEELALGYSNRSAVLFRLEKHTMCLEDIKRALSYNVEGHIREKLIKRLKACKKFKQSTNPKKQIYFKHPLKTHPNIPCASSKIIVSHDTEYGRKVMAAADIIPGEVIAIEKPYAAFLVEEYYYLHCYNCCTRCYTLIPCETCNMAMFCDEECRATAWNRYHRFECPIMPYLQSKSFTFDHVSALRIVLCARFEHDSWDGLLETVSSAEAEKDPILKGSVEVNSIKIYDSQYYTSTHTLETNRNVRENIDILKNIIMSAIILDLLVTYTDFFAEENSIERGFVDFTGGLLLHNILIAGINMHSMDIFSMELRNIEKFGLGIYPFASLLNHSCNKNVYRVFDGTSIILLCLKPIKIGEQIFDNYGPHYTSKDLISRQLDLNFRYKFICHCEACCNNWPTYGNVPMTFSFIRDFGHVLILIISIQQLLSTETNLSSLRRKCSVYSKRLCKAIALIHQFIPSDEFIDCADALEYCWNVMGNAFQFDRVEDPAGLFSICSSAYM